MIDIIINDYLNKYIDIISKKYNIPKRKLKTLINKKKMRTTKDDNKTETKKLQSLSKSKLIELCKEQNINAYGTKYDMIQRLLSSQKKGIIQELKHHIPMIYIRKDNDGHYVHEETELIFDPTEKKVIGKKNDGKIMSLTYNDIQMCLKYKFKYHLPQNLHDHIYIHSDNTQDNYFKNRLNQIENEIDTFNNDDDDDEHE